ncbi:hypothetical protein GCM10010206_55050 [Streptomyces cinerochromogenes]|nr:hypothetical protein GCM10010206_55050 [Streptomyces cinerochromogenes]
MVEFPGEQADTSSAAAARKPAVRRNTGRGRARVRVPVRVVVPVRVLVLRCRRGGWGVGLVCIARA